MKPTTQDIAKVKKHISTVLFPVLYTFILCLIALIIYFYANGYRIDILKQEITQTGVINVGGNIYGAEIYLNNKLLGKTPKSTNLEVGDYDVLIKKDGYINWEKNITIQEGRSYPIEPYLVKQKPLFTTLWTSNGQIIKTWNNTAKSHILFLTQESENEYKLWRYNVDPSLLDFSDNPLTILNLNTQNFSITLSPSGLQALLSITNADNTTSQYIIDTQHLNNLSTLKALDSDLTKSQLYWSNDSSYLIAVSDSKIASYDIKQGTSVDLLTKNSSTTSVWATDTQGYFYILEKTDSSNDISNVYQVRQLNLDGSNSKYILSNIYFNKSDKYIQQYRTSNLSYVEFTTSPESTMASGDIALMNVNLEAQGIFISTNYATYWYNINTQKFIMVSAYPSTLIAYNETFYSLIYKDTNNIVVFTYNKIEGDPANSIGAKTIKNILDMNLVSNLDWLTNNEYVYYYEDGIIYTSDKDGENKSYITQTNNLLELADKTSNNSLITFTKDETGKLSITGIQIH